MNIRYFRPTSLAWWAGVIAIGLGLSLTFWPEIYALGVFGDVLGALAGASDGSPASLILTGLAVIGIRDKMERG